MEVKELTQPFKPQKVHIGRSNHSPKYTNTSDLALATKATSLGLMILQSEVPSLQNILIHQWKSNIARQTSGNLINKTHPHG